MAGVRGILTSDDRDYLKNRQHEGEEETQSETQKRYRLRKKVTQSIHDFDTLMWLSDEDQRLIFRDFDAEMAGAINSMLYWVFYGIIRHTPVDVTEFIRRALRSAAVDALPVDSGQYVESVTVDVNYGEDSVAGRIFSKLLRGKESLTAEDVRELVVQYNVDVDQLAGEIESLDEEEILPKTVVHGPKHEVDALVEHLESLDDSELQVGEVVEDSYEEE